ncbi:MULTISPECIES: ribonuclease P protein component [unclassified Meridianimarinicoccus]|uniref:ribonuclease P protein component n=1 Tax=unclassified Meridianimarinicoccus TaxID=2923344 RepID=UPI0037424ECF
MTVPELTVEQPDMAASPCDGGLSAVCHPIQTLRQRTDFLAASRGRYRAMPGFVLQGRKRRDGEAEGDVIRVGFTCSKKVGNAVARNHAKRRLRALAREVIAEQGKPGWDYVLVGRKDATAQRPFAEMQGDLSRALTKIHAPKAART